jgi:anti-sigma factor RsiW
MTATAPPLLIEPPRVDRLLEAADRSPLPPPPETESPARTRPRGRARAVARRHVASSEPAARIATIRDRIETGAYPTGWQLEIAVQRLIESVQEESAPSRAC